MFRCIAVSALYASCVLFGCSASHVVAAQTAIYRCEVDSRLVFSDTPCGETAIEYVPDDQRVSTVKVQPTVEQSRPRLRSSARSSVRSDTSIAAQQSAHKEECARLAESLREIRWKLRSGYDAEEGARLNERQRKLKLESRSKKCR